MKRIIQIYYGLIIVLTITLIDLTYMNGQFFLMLCPNPKLGEMAQHSMPMSYNIRINSNGDYIFTMENNSPIPKILYGHKLIDSTLKLTTNDLFNLASRVQINTSGLEYKDGYGFDCGTGLGLMTINPYQQFQQIVSKRVILKWLSYPKLTGKFENCFEDSIKVRFFLPSYSIINGLQSNTYSNSISISTKDLKKYLNIDLKEVLREEVFINPEIPAVFPGGQNNLLTYLFKNLKLNTINSETKGKGVYQFIIDENGNLTDIKIMRSMGKSYDNEIIRLLNLMPKWTPGELNGQPIKQKITLPLNILLK